MATLAHKLLEKRRVRDLRSQQIDLLNQQTQFEAFEQFYAKIVDQINEGKIQKLDAYTLFTDLFEDCPESSLQ